jgi:hypothetical protein
MNKLVHSSLFLRALLFSVLCFLLVKESYSIQSYTAGQQLNVLATSGMNLRDAPKGTVLQKIPYGARVKTLQAKSTTNPETIEGIQGNWVKVEYNGAMGFLFDGFLSTLPAPELSNHDLLEYLEQRSMRISGLITTYAYETPEVGLEINSVALFRLANDTIAYSAFDQADRFLTETASFPGVSAEEAYLVLRAMLLDSYQLTSDLVRSGELDAEEFNQFALNSFVLNGTQTFTNEDGEDYEKEVYYTVSLSLSCRFGITIHELGGCAFVQLSYGC